MPRRKKPSGRSPNTYRRKAGIRPPRRTILIVCEGSRTEPLYFERLREYKQLKNVSVKIIPGGKQLVSPRNLIDRAIEEIRRLDWDKRRDLAWVVYDVERAGARPNLDELIQTAKKSNINNAISNPAFEYWYVLHFQETDRPFMDGDEVKQYLRRDIPDYEESLDVFPLIQALTGDALERVNRLCANAQAHWDNFENPSTSVNILVHSIWEEN
jgi:hypothetical protein